MSQETIMNLEPETDLNANDAHDDWLPKWTNKPTLADMKRNLKAAAQYRDEHLLKVDEWLDNFHVRNKAKPKTSKGFSAVQPKLIRKQAEWRYAPLTEPFLATQDLFVASPVSWEDKPGAMQHQLLLNNQFSTVIDRVAFFDEFIRAAVDEGTAFARVGWKFEEALVDEEYSVYEFVAITDEADMENLEKAKNGLMHHKPEWEDALQQSLLGDGTPLRPKFLRKATHKVMKTICNYPTVEVIDIHHLTIDPTCNGKLDDAQFVVYAYETSLAALRASGKFHNLNDIIVSRGAARNELPDFKPTGDANFNFDDKEQTKIVAYEYWGYHATEENQPLQPFVATWVGDTLIQMEDNPFPDRKHPFVGVQYLPVRKSVYGEPDGALIEDNQKIVGALTRGMVDAMARSANGQQGIRKDALDVPNRRKYDAGLDYEFNPGIHPDQAFHMHTYPDIPQSAPLMLQLQNNEADSFTGVKAFSGGLTGDALGRTSAASVRGVLDAASKREVNILRRLASGVLAIGNKIIAMNTEFLNELEYVRVTNEDFVEIHRDKLAGRYDLKLTISTAEEDQAKAEELAFMLQTTGQTIGPEMSQMILTDVAKLRKMPELAKKIETYVPKPDPLEQMMRELEVQARQVEIEERRAQAMERQANAQLTMAKISTEMAKAGNLQSDTDLKNLDMIEQESGVKHARDLENTEQQAKSNMKRDLFSKQLEQIFPEKPKPTPAA